MPRSVVLLLCCLLGAAVLALAAPVPPPRHRPWVTGWGKPIDPKGDCRFEREGDTLTIRVPGEGHWFVLGDDEAPAPRLVREVEGDFALQVRVRGNFERELEREAGIVLLAKDGQAAMRLSSEESAFGPLMCHLYSSVPERGNLVDDSHPAPEAKDGVLYLRLERRGQRLRMAHSRDGRRWETAMDDCGGHIELGPKVQVGVYAAANEAGEFKATFDNLKFTQHRGKQ